MSSYKCDRCHKKFKLKGDWRRHKARKRPCKKVAPPKLLKNTPKFPCPNCDKKYTRKFNLARHLRDVHYISDTDSETEQNLEQIWRSPQLSPEDDWGDDEYINEGHCKIPLDSIFESNDSNSESIDSIFESKMSKNSMNSCQFCGKSMSRKNNLKRHLKTCNEKVRIELEEALEVERRRVKELEKIKLEKEELEQDYFKFMKEVALKSGHSITVNNNQKNMYFVMNNYKEACNLEAKMNPELTEQEIKRIRGSSVQAGVYNLLTGRCISGVDVDKRPFHCVDDSRNKYLLYTGNNWKIDKDASEIINSAIDKVRGVYDTQVVRGESMQTIDRKLKRMDEMFNLEKSGRKRILKELNKTTTIKNI